MTGNLDLTSTRLMLGELANNILSYMQMVNSSNTQVHVIIDKEKQGLQYVFGHIFHKFYKRFR